MVYFPKFLESYSQTCEASLKLIGKIPTTPRFCALRLPNGWLRLELEAVEGFPRQQACFEQMALDATAVAFPVKRGKKKEIEKKKGGQKKGVWSKWEKSKPMLMYRVRCYIYNM